MELIGETFTEQELLSLGLGIERTLNLRRPPFSTPALVHGNAPRPISLTLELSNAAAETRPLLRATLNLTYDEITSRLRYVLSADQSNIQKITAIWLHAGTLGKPAAARYRLFPDHHESGTVTLTASDREALRKGELLVRVYLAGRVGSAIDLPLAIGR
jgi:hypothetical protein